MTATGAISDGVADCAPVLDFLKARTGLVFCPARAGDAAATIRGAMAGEGPGEFVGRLSSNQEVLDGLVDRLTVGETYFFREPAHFEFIRREALPALAGLRRAGHGIRAWSAGCASGEEAYSLAILLEEEGITGGSPVLGTDICRAALKKARTAEYGSWSFRGLGEDFQGRWFGASPGGFRLCDRIKARCAFEHHNLAFDAYPSLAGGMWSMDLILCRNVLIYLGPETIRETARRLYATLADGGWLITGPSDPPLNGMAPFEVVNAGSGVLYRRSGKPCAGAVPAGETAPRVMTEPIMTRAIQSPAAEPGREPPDTAQAGAPAFAAASPPSPEDAIRGIAQSAGVRAAERAAAQEMGRNPASAGVALLRAILLMEMGMNRDAEKMSKVAVYLDRNSAMARFVRATLLRRGGDVRGARREYRNALNIASSVPPDSEVPFSNGGRAGQLAETARAQLALIDGPAGGPP